MLFLHLWLLLLLFHMLFLHLWLLLLLFHMLFLHLWLLLLLFHMLFLHLWLLLLLFHMLFLLLWLWLLWFTLLLSHPFHNCVFLPKLQGDLPWELRVYLLAWGRQWSWLLHLLLLGIGGRRSRLEGLLREGRGQNHWQSVLLGHLGSCFRSTWKRGGVRGVTEGKETDEAQESVAVPGFSAFPFPLGGALCWSCWAIIPQKQQGEGRDGEVWGKALLGASCSQEPTARTVSRAALRRCAGYHLVSCPCLSLSLPCSWPPLTKRRDEVWDYDRKREGAGGWGKFSWRTPRSWKISSLSQEDLRGDGACPGLESHDMILA